MPILSVNKTADRTEISSGGTFHVTLSVTAAPESEIHQRMHALSGHERNIAATAAVAAIRSARLNELFPMEGNASVSPFFLYLS